MKRAAGALVVLLSASVFLYPLCHVVFRCGCGAVWGAAATHCNVHAPHGAHCPWCDQPGLGTVGFLLTLAGQGTVFALVRRRKGSVLAATVVAVAALPLAVVSSAGVCWLATDYPHFLVADARGRLRIPAGPLTTVR
jgi:hypothetical protein